MKKTRSKEVTEKAARWFTLKKKYKDLSSEIDELKDFFRAKIGDDEALKCGDYVVVTTPGLATSIDRELLTEDLGIEKVLKYTKSTPFTKIDVKKEAK